MRRNTGTVRISYRSDQGSSLTPIWVLLGLNFLFFIATLINRNLVITTLGLQPASFLNEPWTIITNLFVHASFWHIFANMLTLFFFGSYLLRLVGEGRFLIVYFLGGIVGNIMFIFLGHSFATAVGASGAIFALGGALAIMRPKLKVIIFPIPIPMDLWIAVIGGFLVVSFLPYIAWQAHLGGMVLGLVAGYFFRRRERRIFRR